MLEEILEVSSKANHVERNSKNVAEKRLFLYLGEAYDLTEAEYQEDIRFIMDVSTIFSQN